jgi:hypothetical protein
MSCILLGDSIAVGLSPFKPECGVVAKSGINSRDYNKKYYNRDLCARTVVISLGSNDNKNIRTFEELSSLRSQVDCADRVLWILPAVFKPDVRDAILRVADNYGDDVIEIRDTGDGVHPTNRAYKALAKHIEG